MSPTTIAHTKSWQTARDYEESGFTAPEREEDGVQGCFMDIWESTVYGAHF
jgi:hypothetical protein